MKYIRELYRGSLKPTLVLLGITALIELFFYLHGIHTAHTTYFNEHTW